ncbi:MAG TPA: AraC family transcriptional regulator, partial [Prolixibacteraceae bacterium]|nr:AraC family transcriptional regulator [Prolixibacteraceae bacterium]
IKERLTNPEYSHLSVLGIAFDAGFNSKSAFNRVFKNVEGETPTQFKKSQSESL